MSFVVAIDGPAGAGKGTVAALVAERLGLVNIDTGAMYRCVTLDCLERGIDSTQIEEIKKVLVPFEHFIKSVQTKERCPKCGAELYKSDLPQHNYVCVACDENF